MGERIKQVSMCLILFMFLSFIPLVHAEGEVNLADLPNLLAEKLNIDIFPAQLLTTAIFLCLFLFPTLLLTRNVFAHLMVGLTIMSFCVAMMWLPVWVMLITCVIVALMFSGTMRDWITGRGRG